MNVSTGVRCQGTAASAPTLTGDGQNAASSSYLSQFFPPPPFVVCQPSQCTSVSSHWPCSWLCGRVHVCRQTLAWFWGSELPRPVSSKKCRCPRHSATPLPLPHANPHPCPMGTHRLFPVYVYCIFFFQKWADMCRFSFLLFFISWRCNGH